uniref:Uncharacterized protein n=1 Tax=Avena sativa TaxID=4498 RepID=A0ACD5WMY6_AVESA
MEAARDVSMDMFRGSLDAAASVGRCGEVCCNLHEMEKALRGTILHIHSSDESTIHPANDLLVQALQNLVRSARHTTNEHYSHMLHCWASKLEEDAEMVRPGENGGKYIFLLNNACAVLQMMRRSEATFANEELESWLSSMIERYTKSYINECWVPLNSTLCLDLDEFTAKFLATCGNQMTWKVAAELRYQLREEIVDLIVPPYEVSSFALQANRRRFSGGLCSFRRVIAGKKQKKYTGEELKEQIRVLFEG